MAKLSNSLMSSIKGAFGGKVSAKTATPEKTKDVNTQYIKIIAKNFLALGSMSRDINISSQNVKELVKIMGGKPRDKTDMHILKESELDEKLKVEVEKETPKPPEPVTKPKKGKLGKKAFDMAKTFSQNKFVKAFAKYFSIAAIVGTLFLYFKDTFIEWAGGLWEAIKEKFDELVSDMKKWFNDVVQPIIDNVKGFIDDMIVKVTDFFKAIGDWFVEKFTQIKDFFEPTLNFLKNTFDKFMSVIDDVKSGVKKVIEYALKVPGVSSVVPDFVLKALNIKQAKEEPIPQKAIEDESAAEARRLSRAAPPVPPPPPPTTEDESAAETRRLSRAKPAAAEPVVLPWEAPSEAPTPAPEAKPPTPSETKPKKLSEETGKKAMLKAMDDKNIADPKMRAAIMAQVGHESGNFTTLSENLNYKAPTLMKLFPKKFANVEDAKKVAAGGAVSVAERIYGGRMGNAPEGSGEGFEYRGRGFIQLTGKQNYSKFGYSSNPDELTKPETAAESALKYMLQFKGDWGDIKSVTKFVNGGYIGLEDRAKHFEAYLNDPKVTQVGAITTAPAGSSVSTASAQVSSEQRQQQKPQTPIIVNAPTNNTKVVQNTQVASAPQKDTARGLVARAA